MASAVATTAATALRYDARPASDPGVGPGAAPVSPRHAPLGDDHLADVIPLRPRPATPAAVYRRRRVVAALLVVGLLVGLGLGLTALIPDAPPMPAATTTAMLAPGDTLWDVAVAVTPPGGDPRVTLEQIRELNGLGTDPVPAWTTVLVPAG